MASLLRSYFQTLLVLLAIPWCLAGAVVGHVLMGFDLSMFSVFGMIALCGMVVNGAFVLVSTRNRYVAKGIAPSEATVCAAEQRFRPILLTALTTFLGLGPMIFETSIQALFLVPMAISLGIGTLVSAVFVMFFVPAVLMGWRSCGTRKDDQRGACLHRPLVVAPDEKSGGDVETRWQFQGESFTVDHAHSPHGALD